MKVTKQVRSLHIYVPAVFPAKLPGETTAHFRIMYSSSNTNVITCIPVHCVHYLPVRVKPAHSTANCRSTRYMLSPGYPISPFPTHGATRISCEFEDRRHNHTRHFSVPTDASTKHAQTQNELKWITTRMNSPAIYVCPGSFPGEMSRRTARSFKFNYSNSNTNV